MSHKYFWMLTAAIFGIAWGVRHEGFMAWLLVIGGGAIMGHLTGMAALYEKRTEEVRELTRLLQEAREDAIHTLFR